MTQCHYAKVQLYESGIRVATKQEAAVLEDLVYLFISSVEAKQAATYRLQLQMDSKRKAQEETEELTHI